PFHVAAGGSLHLPVVLTAPAFADPIAWNANQVLVNVVTTGGPEASVGAAVPGWVTITPDVGTEAEVRVSAAGQSWLAGTVQGVALDVGSIELVAAYVADGDENVPLAARAVVRDSSGGLLYGAPVQWKVVTGALAVEPGGADLPGRDYAVL